MNELKKYANSVVFCLFLFVTVLLLLVLPDRAYSEREKRYLSQTPQIAAHSILDGDVQKSLENWSSDQLPGRDLYVGIHAYWELLLGRNHQQKIYHAKDGFLINAPASQDLTICATTLKRIDQFAQNCNVPVSMVLVPSTGWIKQALLPLGHKPSPDDQIFCMAEESLSHTQLLDFREELLQADSFRDVCYRTDHHLTAYGNYTIYETWCRQTGRSCLPKEAYTVETVSDFYGTTWSGSGYWMTRPDEIELWDSGAEVSVAITDGGEEPILSDNMFFRNHLSELDKYPVYLDGNHCLTEITNTDADDGTILLIKDSYAHCFAPFLADQYSRVILLDLRFYRGSVTELIKENAVDEVLFFYGTSTILTDTNSAWLF